MKILIATLVTGCWALTGGAAAEQAGFVAVTFENDLLSNPFGPHQDRHYTAGLKITVFGGDSFATNLTGRLDALRPSWDYTPAGSGLGFVIGQNIYTPEDILNPAPVPGDRPYAGWLYTGLVYQRRGSFSDRLAVMENFEINLGVVGPESLAEEAQKTIHRWRFPDNIPQGWDNQLKFEPGLELKYARLWRYAPLPALSRHADLIPQAGFVLGNVRTLLSAGATGRIGFHLPADFGIPVIHSPASVNGGLTREESCWSVYAFGGVEGRIVGHDITLDGNSFRDGPSVDKNVFAADLRWGAAVQLFRHVELSYTRIVRTEEFDRQVGRDILGSLTLTGKFCF